MGPIDLLLAGCCCNNTEFDCRGGYIWGILRVSSLLRRVAGLGFEHIMEAMHLS